MLKRLVSEQQLPPVASLLSEDMLVNVGLSSVPADDEFRHTSSLAPFFFFYYKPFPFSPFSPCSWEKGLDELT